MLLDKILDFLSRQPLTIYWVYLYDLKYLNEFDLKCENFVNKFRRILIVINIFFILASKIILQIQII
jgi:hypothetical protein